MSDTTQPLIVLRFRDIELQSGGTIAQHRTMIAQYGYCWWGWLFRDYERNPHVELKQLGQLLAQTGAFPVALFDTGRGMLFRANCREIRATSSPQRSPEPAATPAYYNDRRAPAWFQITDISESDTSLVVGKNCREMPSASDDCFVDLLGQVVRHIKDLRRQEVTLWVLG
jgi:hypothetical protein